jgi:hypothetical protein
MRIAVFLILFATSTIELAAQQLNSMVKKLSMHLDRHSSPLPQLPAFTRNTI